MAKRKSSESNDEFSLLARLTGSELLEDSGKNEKGFIDTGILAMNYANSGKYIGGGIPIGACIEIYGGSSSGKTLIGTNILRGVQSANGIAIFLDAERTINKDFAVKASHVDPKKLIVMDADTLEKAFARIYKIIRQARDEAKIPMERPIVIIYDSIAVSPSEREFAETTIDMETATKTEIKEAGAGADKPGERAKICGKELRKLTPILEENNASVVFINQVRQKIGVMFGSDETSAGGGRALEYYCTTRIRMSSFKKIKDKVGKVIGVNVSMQNVKNKCAPPFQDVKDMRLFFDKGIDPFGGLLGSLLTSGRIEYTGKAGTYKVLEPWAGGKEVTFKSSKERNDVPYEALLECPTLVDAESAEQVQYYVDMFGAALDAVNSDMAAEEDVRDDEAA